ncbi:MAG: hypothetical protein NXI13_12445 [Proteobacteria bacterium]|nr:hypothetical protein [Pseudomonadota bacterium]
MDIDDDEMVDLDALFDALNIAVKDGADDMEFVTTGKDGSGTLTVSGQALSVDGMPAPVEDLDIQSADLLKTVIVSDES